MASPHTGNLGDLRAAYVTRLNTTFGHGQEDLPYERADVYQADLMDLVPRWFDDEAPRNDGWSTRALT